MNKRQKKKQQKRFLHSIFTTDDGRMIKIIQDTFKRGKPIVKAWLITNLIPISCSPGDNVTPYNMKFKCSEYTKSPEFDMFTAEMLKIWADIVKDPVDLTDYNGISNLQTIDMNDETITESVDIYNTIHDINYHAEQTKIQALTKDSDNMVLNNLGEDVNTDGNM